MSGLYTEARLTIVATALLGAQTLLWLVIAGYSLWSHFGSAAGISLVLAVGNAVSLRAFWVLHE